MKKLFIAIILAVSIAGCKSLPDRSQTVLLANVVLTQLLDLYKYQQNQCINSHPGDDDGAWACVDHVRNDWEPVFTAFDALSVATDSELKVAWCNFLKLLVEKNLKIEAIKDLYSRC